MRQWSLSSDNPLLTAVVAYDEAAEFVLDPPIGDWQKVKSALRRNSAIGERPREHLHRDPAGARQVPDVPHRAAARSADRRRHRRSGRRSASWSMSWSKRPARMRCRSMCSARRPRGGRSIRTRPIPRRLTRRRPTTPPPCTAPSRSSPSGSMCRAGRPTTATTMAERPNFDLIDSGFGPFALERLCRASRGQFFAIRPEPAARLIRTAARRTSTGRPGSELRFEAKAAQVATRRTTSARPSTRKLLAENKARRRCTTRPSCPSWSSRTTRA